MNYEHENNNKPESTFKIWLNALIFIAFLQTINFVKQKRKCHVFTSVHVFFKKINEFIFRYPILKPPLCREFRSVQNRLQPLQSEGNLDFMNNVIFYYEGALLSNGEISKTVNNIGKRSAPKNRAYLFV